MDERLLGIDFTSVPAALTKQRGKFKARTSHRTFILLISHGNLYGILILPA